GCQDGPLYALKAANPYFSLREWREDEKLGVTDHQRRKELLALAKQLGSMSPNDQLFWSKHLGRILENDPSPEMRRLAILAAAELDSAASVELIERGLGDENLKVKMEACRSLGKRSEPAAASLLAATLGSTQDADLRNSAIAALGNHEGGIPTDALRIALENQDPATLQLAMESLRGVTGQDLGDDPKLWIAALDQPVPSGDSDPAVRFAEGEGSSVTR
ncbi:MAG: HEAT repeat domain-containing protein, partial [Planctomycetota bacterium]